MTPRVPVAGTLARIELTLPPGSPQVREVAWTLDPANHGRLFGTGVVPGEGGYTSDTTAVDWDTAGAGSNRFLVSARVTFNDNSVRDVGTSVDVIESRPAGPVVVATTAGEKAAIPFDVQAVWVAIRNRTQAIGFGAYSQFIDNLVCCLAGRDCVMPANRTLASAMAQRPQIVGLADQLGLNPARILSQGVYGYDLLRLATQAFLAMNVGLLREGPNGEPRIPTPPDFDAGEEQSRLGYPTDPDTVAERLRAYLKDDGRVLPYLDSVVTAMLGTGWRESGALGCYQDVLQHRLESPAMLELIWSYWHEEGALTQTMNAIALRFQNKRRRGNDPLAQLEIDPLRPLNSLIWGHIQSEYKRLSVVRRAYEYDHHYGITLRGRAIPALMTADSRSKFLEAFHNLLTRTAAFYRADADTTVVADAYPVLNALRDLHLVLAEGAHNQFGDLPWTARAEMLIEQWLLARPEMREFLRGRAMVPYAEPWMGQVDAMKRLQGWRATGVSSFRELAVYGEQLLLSVRYTAWTQVNNEAQARAWARYWKPEVQGYVHAYRAVTNGQVDLAVEPVNQLDAERRRMLPARLMAETAPLLAVERPMVPARAAGG
ncbi:MAG TPA: hypothetical protein VE033_14425 [Acetobacteraceae bacterium]|nr:hypothetical protein [Acetobacteraceae bacterium]